MTVAVVVSMRVVGGANVVHLVRRAAFHAARYGLLAAQGDPENVVRVGGAACAADVLLLAGGVDDDWVLEGACLKSATILLPKLLCQNGRRRRTNSAGVQWPHVEDINALHLS